MRQVERQAAAANPALYDQRVKEKRVRGFQQEAKQHNEEKEHFRAVVAENKITIHELAQLLHESTRGVVKEFVEYDVLPPAVRKGRYVQALFLMQNAMIIVRESPALIKGLPEDEELRALGLSPIHADYKAMVRKVAQQTIVEPLSDVAPNLDEEDITADGAPLPADAGQPSNVDAPKARNVLKEEEL